MAFGLFMELREGHEELEEEKEEDEEQGEGEGEAEDDETGNRLASPHFRRKERPEPRNRESAAVKQHSDIVALRLAYSTGVSVNRP